MIDLKRTYGPVSTDGTGTRRLSYTGEAFDEISRQIVSTSGTQMLAFLDPVPENYWRENDYYIIFTCGVANTSEQYTATFYYYQRATSAGQLGSFRTTTQANSGYCGFAEPIETGPSCDLVIDSVTQAATSAIVNVSGAHGTVRYSRDGGGSSQLSNKFTGLVLGTEYQVTVTDAGAKDCSRTTTFTFTGLPPVVVTAPAGPPVNVVYALRPACERVGSYPAGTLVHLHLWIENAHNKADYQEVYSAKKVVGQDGFVAFQLDKILRDRLRADAPDPGATATIFATSSVLNYYTYTVAIDPETNEPLSDPPQVRALRTALRSGLNLDGGLLTTQPQIKAVYSGAFCEFLYLLVSTTELSTVRITRKLRRTDGSEESGDELVPLNAGGFDGYRLLIVPAMLGPLPADTAVLEVSIAAPGVRPQFYGIRPSNATARAFLFENSVGGVDTLTTVGAGSQALSAKAALAERGPALNDIAGETALASVYDLEVTRAARVATGWLSQPELHWLQCFPLARTAWLLRGGQLRPLVLSKRELNHQRDDSRLEGLTFEYTIVTEEAGWEALR